MIGTAPRLYPPNSNPIFRRLEHATKDTTIDPIRNRARFPDIISGTGATFPCDFHSHKPGAIQPRPVVMLVVRKGYVVVVMSKAGVGHL